MTHQPQQEEVKGFGGCTTALSLVVMYVYAGWITPPQWRWFVFLTFTVLVSVIEILKVERKKI